MASTMRLSLGAAKKKKDDEFYTRYSDVAEEMSHYLDAFRGKCVYLNCDSQVSNFWKFFKDNFVELGLRRLICSSVNGYAFELKRNGEFVDGLRLYDKTLSYDSPEAKELLNQSDIVVTNPPFSRLRDFVPMVVDSGKQFIIVGTLKCLQYADIFHYLADGLLWVGSQHYMTFDTPSGEKTLGNCCWVTNINDDRHLVVSPNSNVKYSLEQFPNYDNYPAIEVSKLSNIPIGYHGVIGVPVTFLAKYREGKSVFKILGLSKRFAIPDGWSRPKQTDPMLDGRRLSTRVFIQRRC